MSAAPASPPDAERQTPIPDSTSRKREDNGDDPQARNGDSRGETKAAEDQQKDVPEKQAKQPLSPRKRALLIAGALVIALGGGAYWYHGTFFEDTDDAQVDAYISSISARVAGTVSAVLVEDNQPVRSGQPLLQLDPVDLRVARDQAKAALAQAEAQLRGAQADASASETSNQTLVSTNSSDVASGYAGIAEAQQAAAQAAAQVTQAEADARLASIDRERTEQLFRSGAVARAELDSRQAAAQAAQAKLEAQRNGLEAAQRRVEEQAAKAHAASSRLNEAKENAPDVLTAKRALVDLRSASVDAARAGLEQAELNLSYATISAPVSGVVGKRSVNVGDRVAAGQALLGITQTDRLWVTANFRETQVKHMHPGQKVTVHVDALSRDFDAEVESFAAATGSRYSVLPPENASGNYVKVVQRLPVRVRFVPKQAGLELLRPGMSVEPKVRVK